MTDYKKCVGCGDDIPATEMTFVCGNDAYHERCYERSHPMGRAKGEREEAMMLYYAIKYAKESGKGIDLILEKKREWANGSN